MRNGYLYITLLAILGLVTFFRGKTRRLRQMAERYRQAQETMHRNSEAYVAEAENNIAQLTAEIDNARTPHDWTEAYKHLVYWELQLQEAQSEMSEMLKMQKQEANNTFMRFIRQNYENWLEGHDTPMLSPDIIKQKVFPLLDKKEKVFFVIFDNLRYDQWRTLWMEMSGTTSTDSILSFSEQ